MTGHDPRRPTWDRSRLTNDVNSLNWKKFHSSIIKINFFYIPNFFNMGNNIFQKKN